ncbi:hypothetical protein EMIT048CA2_240063 [Pseudomonas chlororaphis]
MFNRANETHFSLSIEGVQSDLQVVSFKGTEGVSQPFRFDLELVSENPDLDLEGQWHPRPDLPRGPGRCRQTADPLQGVAGTAAGLPRAPHQPAHLPAAVGAEDHRPDPRRARHPGQRLPVPARHAVPGPRLLRAVRRNRPALHPAPVRRGRPALPLPAQPGRSSAGIR